MKTTTGTLGGAARVAAASAVLCLVVPALGCRSGCGATTASSDDDTERAVSREKPGPAPTLAALAREVGLTFPASARLVGASRESGMDDYLQFKVELDAKDLAAFLATSPIPLDALEPGTHGFLGSDEGFWDPHRAPHIRTGQKQLPGARVLNIGVSEGAGGAGGQAAVYIVNHGT